MADPFLAPYRRDLKSHWQAPPPDALLNSAHALAAAVGAKLLHEGRRIVRIADALDALTVSGTPQTNQRFGETYVMERNAYANRKATKTQGANQFVPPL
jgi:hypothetical protein